MASKWISTKHSLIKGLLHSEHSYDKSLVSYKLLPLVSKLLHLSSVKSIYKSIIKQASLSLV